MVHINVLPNWILKGLGIIDLIPAAVNAVRAEVGRKLQLFGCTGKAVTNSPSKAELIRIVVNEVLKELKNK